MTRAMLLANVVEAAERAALNAADLPNAAEPPTPQARRPTRLLPPPSASYHPVIWCERTRKARDDTGR